MALEDFKLFTSLWFVYPKYPLDESYHKIVMNANVLMLSGQLDPATHLATRTCKIRTFYTFLLVDHVAILTTLVDYKCPLKLISIWIEWSELYWEISNDNRFFWKWWKLTKVFDQIFEYISKLFEDFNLTKLRPVQAFTQ